MRPADPPATPFPVPPSLREARGTWLRIRRLSFGGPAVQIALMHRAVAAERR